MAQSTFPKPVDQEIKDLNGKIGDIPSGQTVEGQITALNSNLTALRNSVPNTYKSDVNGNSSKSFTLSNNARIVLFSFGNSTSRMSIWNIFTNSSGGVTFGEMINGSSMLSITSNGNNSITITNSGSTTIILMFVTFNGSITVST